MVKKVLLSKNARSLVIPLLPVAHYTAQPPLGVKRQQCMDVIRQQEEQCRPPDLSSCVFQNGVQQQRGQPFVPKRDWVVLRSPNPNVIDRPSRIHPEGEFMMQSPRIFHSNNW